MTTTMGPKLKFTLPQILDSQSEVRDDIYQENEGSSQNINQSKISRRVSFADSSIVFLRYNDEDLVNFRERLKSQIPRTLPQTETNYLNPSLTISPRRAGWKSCFKGSLDSDN